MDLATYIRDIPDFPVKGVLFRDITTLLKHPAAFREAIERMAEHYRGWEIDLVAAVESRGYIFGAPLAAQLGAGFVPVRKMGKLPAQKINISYSLEYGTETLEMHVDAVSPGSRVLVVDDLIATGGSARATASLVEALGGKVIGMAFLIELLFLGGREKIKEYEVFSLIQYE
ncbi:MAG: adenine phosphoribosyltransferase [Chloroflexi bacterium RBG_16_57_9]|nr:MAG: adenine phosphoribosyltransferase [Chloroflexi bacterium RBG_16_57_9]